MISFFSLRMFLMGTLFISGCSDRRADIALGILYGDGRLPSAETNKAFTGAILGRFPIGSSSNALKHFAASLGGKCVVDDSVSYADRASSFVCIITDYTQIASSTYIDIIFNTEGDIIKHLTVRRDFSGSL